MFLPRLSLLVTALLATGCFLIDKIDELEGDDPEVFDPGTTPISRTFSAPTSSEIRLLSFEGVGLTIPPNSLETDTGVPVSGSASIILTCHIFDLSHPWNMPGGLLAQDASGVPGALTSFGAIEVIMIDGDGNNLNLKPGTTAEIAIPALSGGPDVLPLWYYDETLGIWIEDGMASKVEQSYVGTVTHFTKWNADIFANRACIRGAIIDGDGFAVSGTIVTAQLQNAPGLSGGQLYSDEEGAFQFDGLSGGATYRVTAFGYESSDTLTITLPEVGSECIVVDVLVLENGALGAVADGDVDVDVDVDSDPAVGTFAGSCDSVASQGICVDYTGTSYTAQGVQSACTSYNPPATFSSLPCSRSNALGVCTQYSGSDMEIQQLFDATYYTLTDGTTACNGANGVWTAI